MSDKKRWSGEADRKEERRSVRHADTWRVDGDRAHADALELGEDALKDAAGARRLGQKDNRRAFAAGVAVVHLPERTIGVSAPHAQKSPALQQCPQPS
eukprot:3698458-Rhodomonas_salina.2